MNSKVKYINQPVVENRFTDDMGEVRKNDVYSVNGEALFQQIPNDDGVTRLQAAKTRDGKAYRLQIGFYRTIPEEDYENCNYCRRFNKQALIRTANYLKHLANTLTE